jgi:hypothetical protein
MGGGDGEILMTFRRSCLVALLLAAFWHPFPAATSWKPVDSFTYDWKGDGKPYQFSLDIPSHYDSGGDFTRLRIHRAGRLLLTVEDDDGITKISEGIGEGKVQELLAANPVKSPHLLFTPTVRGSSRYPLLFLFGCAYASSPGSLHGIALGENGIPNRILHLQTFILTGFDDLNRDGKHELVGKPCLSQSVDDGILTYDPYHIYKFGSTATSAMKLNRPLSKKYNLEHYHGWAGMECREDVAVVLHPPGGGMPIIMETQKAMGLKKDAGKVVPGWGK